MRNHLLYFKYSLFVVLSTLSVCKADFTPNFRKFLHDTYGVAIQEMLERTDLGLDASFGGKLDAEQESSTDPVIIVHGITNKITRFEGMRQFLKSKGYKSSEIYGTTWGDAGATPVGLVDLKCSYVKQLRALIIAVSQYTGKQVDIIAYSMGAPLARKAILGGNCVDTREILGTPITQLIDTFLSVAGANYGSALCLVALPVGTCNRKTGLHCDSEYLQDINANEGYEGRFVFSVFSTADEKVGFRACGKPVAPIRGGTGYVKKDGLTHDQLMDNTLQLQKNFIERHSPK